MDLFNTFEALDVAAIIQYISQRQEENLQLEFKTVGIVDLSSRDDRKNLAITMSSFANSSGGLIVWGVIAKKNAEGIDCAVDRLEIAPLPQFMSQLTRFAGDALSPRAEGVKHRAIFVNADAGFALTLVPESASGPHMAKLGEDRYYKRSGDSNYKMEHYDLEDMFGRRQKPSLELHVEQKPGEAVYPQEELHFMIINVGRAVARHVGCFVQLPPDCNITGMSDGLENVTHLNNGRPTGSYANNTGVFHPNGVRIHVGRIRFIRPDQTHDIICTAKLDCDGTRTQELKFSIPPLPVEAVQPTPQKS